jgi:hypothetical protein
MLAFWVTLVYAVGVIAWRVIDHRYVHMAWQSLRGVSFSEPFVVCGWGFALAPPAMAAANLLAVLAFFLAARGRFGGNVLITYALLQATLLVILFSSIVTLVNLGMIQYYQNGYIRTLRVHSEVLLTATWIAAVLCVPLVAFLVPPLRRACFTSGAND